MLGAKPSSLLLANKTIWIEGISDRLYIRHGLKLYFEFNQERRKPIENLDYAFIEFSGSNLKHYLDSEKDININSINNCKNIFMIVDKDDSDKENSSKYKRYEEIQEKIKIGGGEFKITKGREIENYITPEILRKIWPNLPIKIKEKNYLNKPLPKFLKQKGLENYISKDTFSSKKTIAEKIIEEQKNWSDLSSEMQELISNLADFIKPN